MNYLKSRVTEGSAKIGAGGSGGFLLRFCLLQRKKSSSSRIIKYPHTYIARKIMEF